MRPEAAEGNGIVIIANHAHLMPPQPGNRGWPEGDLDMLVRHLDLCGIDKAVIFPPFACQVGNSMKKANLWALQEARKRPDRILPAGTIFPLAPDILEMLDILHAEGIRLAKVHPSIDPYDVTDPAADPCYARAAELGIALDFHTGPHGSRLSWVTPTKYDDLAWNHPTLTLVFEHLGGRTYFEEFMAILANRETGGLFGGLTSVLAKDTQAMWYLGPERIVDLVRCVGANKLIYGLDFPWNSAAVNARDIAMIRSLDIPQGDKDKILGGTLAALVGA